MHRAVREEEMRTARMETPKMVTITRISSSAWAKAERAITGIAWNRGGCNYHSPLRTLKGKPRW